MVGFMEYKSTSLKVWKKSNIALLGLLKDPVDFQMMDLSK